MKISRKWILTGILGGIGALLLIGGVWQIKKSSREDQLIIREEEPIFEAGGEIEKEEEETDREIGQTGETEEEIDEDIEEDESEEEISDSELEALMKATFYREENCPECDKVEVFIKKTEGEILAGKKDIGKDINSFGEMLERGALCDMERWEITIPFLWVEGEEEKEGECLVGAEEITEFLQEFLEE